MRLDTSSPARIWTQIYALFLLTGFLLYAPSVGYRGIVGPKHHLFFLSGILFFAVLSCLLPKERKLLERPRPVQYLSILGAALLCWIFLSSVCSAYPETVWLGSRRHEGFFTYAIYIGIFLASAWLLTMGPVHLWGGSLTAWISFTIVLLQYLGFNPLGMYPQGLCFHDRGTRYSGEYLGTIGNSDLLSAMLTVLCLWLWGAYAVSDRKDRLVFLSGGTAAWSALLLSEVAAGPVAVLGCLVLCLPMCLKKGLALSRLGDIGLCTVLPVWGKLSLGYRYESGLLSFFFHRNALTWGIFTLCIFCVLLCFFLRKIPQGRCFPKLARSLWILYGVCIIGVFLFLVFYTGPTPILQDLHLLAVGHPPDTLGSSRIAIWKDSMELICREPLLGGGPDTYDLRSDLIFTRVLPSGQIRRVSVDAAHNEYLNLAATCGIPAALMLIFLILSILALGRKYMQKDLFPIFMTVLGYSIHGLFGISQSLVSPLFWLFLGSLLGAAGKTKNQL